VVLISIDTLRWGDGREEVYDLNADPQEGIDLAGVAGVLPPLRQLYAGAGEQRVDSPAGSALRLQHVTHTMACPLSIGVRVRGLW